MINLNAIKGLILDIDGILYEGNQGVPGAVELIANLNESATPYVLFSNNTTNSIENHLTKLSRLGMQVPSASLLTAAMVAARMIAHEAALGARCFVIGETGLMEALLHAGLRVTQSDDRDLDYVVVGMDRQLSYEKLKIATRAVRGGAALISTNADPVYMDWDGIIPASGAIQAALEAATGVKARLTGKPEPPGFRMALDLLKCSAEETGMLGDQPEIDILGAARAGIKTILISSSLTQAFSSQDAPVIPDAAFESTLDFFKIWKDRHLVA
jgi:4-nitrophenyl phosphatase